MVMRRASGTCNRCARYAQGVGDDDKEATAFLVHNHEGHLFDGEVTHEDVVEKPTPIVIREELRPPGGKRRKR